MNVTKFESGLDIIRVMAIIFVIAGHFLYLHTNFMHLEIDGPYLAFQCFCMTIFYTAVPLFIILTGYLNSKKHYENISIKTFKGLWSVLTIYFIYSGLLIIFRETVLHENKSIVDYIRLILNFRISPYAWYIELYICLALLMPFLNITMVALRTRKNQLSLIGICALLGFVPILVNRGGWHIAPNMFQLTAAIFAYYLIGYYIARYQPKVNRWLLIGIIIFLASTDALVNLALHRTFHFIGVNAYSLFFGILSTAIFMLCYRTQIRKPHAWGGVILRQLSNLTLDVFLCCWMFDALYYPLFKKWFFVNDHQFFPYILLIVPCVYLSSLIIGFLRIKTTNVIGLFHIIK